nr:MAG TPA: Protein of unknown function (DUF1642) [Caudoviricetes sp.]
MNKQELLEKIKALKPDEQCLHEYQPEEWEAFQDGFDDGKCYVELIIEQLDEPVRSPEQKPLEPEKPVVPQYVADWIEWCKNNNVTLLGAMIPIDELGTAICDDKKVKSLEASKWATRNQETFAQAWLFGYEVEKEKLYTVEIPNPNGGTYLALCKDVDGKLFVETFLIADWETFGKCKLTEAEIKEDFEWAWQFAKEVDE